MRPQHQNSTKLRPQNGSFRPVTIWGPPLIKSWIRPWGNMCLGTAQIQPLRGATADANLANFCCCWALVGLVPILAMGFSVSLRAYHSSAQLGSFSSSLALMLPVSQVLWGAVSRAVSVVSGLRVQWSWEGA